MKSIKILILISLCWINTDLCYGQDKVYKLKSENELCSATITFLKGGDFIYERGCEGSSFTCFGAWRTNGNKIKLEPVDNKNINLIRYFESGPSMDSFSSIKVLDIKGKDMTSKMKYTILDTFHKEILTTDNWSAASRKSKFIRLATLKNVFEVNIDIQNLKPVNNIIQLNIPENYIYNKNSVWEIPKVLDYLLENNCLVEQNENKKEIKYYCPK